MRDPRDRPGHDRHDLPRLRRRRAARRAAPTASSSSTSRGRAGSSTTPPRSGTSRARSRARRSTTRASGAGDLQAIGITNQRETVCVWDPQTGEPLHRALVWQDRRTAARCDELRAAGHEPLVRTRTGLVLDPYFSATKIEWLLEQRRRPARARRRRPRGVRHDRRLARLQAHRRAPHRRHERLAHDALRHPRAATGTTSCSRCSATSRARRCPRRCRASASSARVRDGALGDGHDGVPVSGIAGDQQAALYGQGCLEPGLGKNTYGTGSFVLLNSGEERADRAAGPARDGRLGDRRAHDLRAGGRDLRHRRGACSGCATASASSSGRPRPRRSPPRWTPTTASTSSRR